MSSTVLDYTKEIPVIEGLPTAAALDETIVKPINDFPQRRWFIGLAITGTMLMIGVVSLSWLLWKGVGVWGINQPVA